MPSVRAIGYGACYGCGQLTDVELGGILEKIKLHGFEDCPRLQRIAIPLKDGMITEFDTFRWCENLKHVDLVSRVKNYVKPLLRCTWRGGEMI